MAPTAEELLLVGVVMIMVIANTATCILVTMLSTHVALFLWLCYAFLMIAVVGVDGFLFGLVLSVALLLLGVIAYFVWCVLRAWRPRTLTTRGN